MTDTHTLHETLSQWQRGAFVVMVVGVALGVLAAMTNLDQFLRSYLMGFLFWWSVTMGCLGLLMLYYLVGGRWGTAARPLLECGSLLAPLTALLFLPVALGIEQLYPWANASFASAEKALYLNPPFFYGRAAAYFLIWSVLAISLRQRKLSFGTDRSRWRRLLSAGGLVALIMTVTFAAIDWAMSLDPAWFSSIYGALVAMGGALAGLALAALVFCLLEMRQQPASSLIASQTLADLATLMLAFLMLWAYFAFSQFLIIWAGNLPEENVWYVIRLSNGWQWIGLAIVVLQFAVPFSMLLSREMKQNPRALAIIASLIFVMQFVYILWTISPSFHPKFFIHWADIAVPLAIGGLWASVFIGLLRRRVPQMLATNQL